MQDSIPSANRRKVSKQVLAGMGPELGLTAVSLASVTGSWRQALNVAGRVQTYPN